VVFRGEGEEWEGFVNDGRSLKLRQIIGCYL
jgi:hypothetical protein